MKPYKEGYERYLIIPSSGELLAAVPGGGLVRITGNRLPVKSVHSKRMVAGYKEYLENTHIEALEARRTMIKWGLPQPFWSVLPTTCAVSA